MGLGGVAKSQAVDSSMALVDANGFKIIIIKADGRHTSSGISGIELSK